MKQGQIVKAFTTLKTLTAVKGLPFGTLSGLYQARRALSGHVEAQQEKEMEIIRELGEVQQDGTIKFNDPEEGPKEMNRRFLEIVGTEIDAKIEPVTVRINQAAADKLGLDGEILGALDGFVNFELNE